MNVERRAPCWRKWLNENFLVPQTFWKGELPTIYSWILRKAVFNFIVHFRFTELLQSAEDFIVDIPKLWEYVAELVEPLFEEGVINLNFLPQLSSMLNSSLVANFVAAVLKELVKVQVCRALNAVILLHSSFPPLVLFNHWKRQIRVPQ